MNRVLPTNGLPSDLSAAKIDPLRKPRAMPRPRSPSAAASAAAPKTPAARRVAPRRRQASLDLALDLGASLNPQEVIRRLMQRAVKALQADRASLVILEEG